MEGHLMYSPTPRRQRRPNHPNRLLLGFRTGPKLTWVHLGQQHKIMSILRGLSSRYLEGLWLTPSQTGPGYGLLRVLLLLRQVLKGGLKPDPLKDPKNGTPPI